MEQKNKLNSTKVYVVTDGEAGWDCVRGVFETLKDAVEYCGGEYIDEKKYYDFDSLIIHIENLYKKCKEDKDNPYNIDYKRQTKLEL